MSKKKQEKEVVMKNYLIEKENGKRMRITVPANWKVTFGPAARGLDKSTNPQRYQMPLALRFYENETQQRAIFTDVKSFRDMSIPVMVEEIRTQEKDGHIEVEGKRKTTVFRATTKEWVDPDKATDEFPQLPSDSDIFKL
jgi:hypothetical protein